MSDETNSKQKYRTFIKLSDLKEGTCRLISFAGKKAALCVEDGKLYLYELSPIMGKKKDL